MKTRIYGLALALCLLTPLYGAAQDHTDVVRAVIARLQDQGVNTSGPCGAFQITKRVAWELRGEGYGLLGGKSPAQNGCAESGDKFAVDWLLKADGHGVDILRDAGGANTPTWGEEEAEARFYRPAFATGGTTDEGQPPTPPVVVPPVVLPIPFPDGQVVSLLQSIINLQQEQLEALMRVDVTTKSTNEHVISMDRTLTQTLGSISKFVGKYIAPAIGGYIMAKQLGNPQATPATN
jgi:hypothetical protein